MVTRAEDNPFPSVLFEETEAADLAANPASGQRRLIIDPSDHALYIVDTAGAATAVGGAFGGDAGDVPFTPAAGIAATDVQAAIVEDAGDLAAHLADSSDAHDASAISVLDSGALITGTDVEAALAEIAALTTLPGARYPVQQVVSGGGSSTTRVPVLGATPTNGNKLILASIAEGTDAISSVVTTNVSWSLLGQSTAATAPVVEIWVGTVSASASATTTVTYAASAQHNVVLMEWTGLAGTLDQGAQRHVTTDTTGHHYTPVITPTVHTALVVIAGTTTNNSTTFSGFNGIPGMFQAVTGNTIACIIGFPGRRPTYGAIIGGNNATFTGYAASII